MSIKLITIDLDGTLLNSAKQVSERNRRALMAAEAQGVMVTLASGRCSPVVWGFARMAGLKASPVISNNGPRVQGPDGATLAEKCLDPEAAREGHAPLGWHGDVLHTVQRRRDVLLIPPEDYQRFAEAAAGPDATPRHVFDGDTRYEAGARHAHKLVCFDDDTARLERARALLDGMGDALEVNSSWWNNIEVMHRASTRAGQCASCARYTAWSATR